MSILPRTAALLAVGSILLFCLFAATAAPAQGVNGIIQGQVTDTTGGVVPGASATAIHTKTNVTKTVLANDTGFYIFPRLLTGTYRLEIEMSGFRRFVRENVEVRVTDIIRVDAQLEVGEVSQEVTVTAAAPLLKTDQSDISHQITERQVRELPLFGRNVTQVMNTIPGTMFGFNNRRGQVRLQGVSSAPTEDVNLFTNGLHGGRNYSTYDGVANRSLGRGGQSYLVPAADSVSEVKIITNAYDAEYDQVGGVMTQMVTKAGTNAYHGTIFWFHRNNIFGARNPFTEATTDLADLKWNQFGGTVGGPIVKDRVFFFGSFQGIRIRQGRTSIGTVPLPEYRLGDFSSLPQFPIFDPLTGGADGRNRTQFANNQIPSTRINPVSRNVMGLLPEANINTGDPTRRNYINAFPTATNNEQYITRFDWNIDDQSQFFFRWNYGRDEIVRNTLFGSPLQDPVVQGLPGYGVAVNYNRLITPNFLVEGRFGFVSRDNTRVYQDGGRQTSEELGIPNVNINGFDGLIWMQVDGPRGNFNTIGQDRVRPITQQTRHFVAGFVWTKGKHTLKWGAEFKVARQVILAREGGALALRPQRIGAFPDPAWG